MKKDDISQREKSAAVGLVVCFVAMIAIVGMITFSNYQRKTEAEDRQFADAAENEKEDQVADNSMLNNDMDAPYDFVNEDLDTNAQTANTNDVHAEIPDSLVSESVNDVVMEAPIQDKSLNFTSAEALSWPVDGNVILSFNMEQTVYFSTLDQYKYNPAMIIEGSVGQEVMAAAT